MQLNAAPKRYRFRAEKLDDGFEPGALARCGLALQRVIAAIPLEEGGLPTDLALRLGWSRLTTSSWRFMRVFGPLFLGL